MEGMLMVWREVLDSGLQFDNACLLAYMITYQPAYARAL